MTIWCRVLACLGYTMDVGKGDVNGCILLRNPWKLVWLVFSLLCIVEVIVGQSDTGGECAVLVEYRVQSAFGNRQYYVASIDIENADPEKVCCCFTQINNSTFIVSK